MLEASKGGVGGLGGFLARSVGDGLGDVGGPDAFLDARGGVGGLGSCATFSPRLAEKLVVCMTLEPPGTDRCASLTMCCPCGGAV